MATNYLSFLLLFFFSLYNVLSVHGHSKNQVENLNKLRKAKGVDTSNFEPYLHDVDIEISYDGESKEQDKIVKLPGQPPVKFDQYGGYITVNQSAGRAFFYYFVEAEQDKDSLPLLLWLNGGPGCSSLGYGAMQELGPFRVGSDGKTLYKNVFAWNHAANVLFVESPAGVGFSYSNTSSDYHIGDKKTAADNYVFLLNWLKKFPEYKDRDFYISGESYAGHYVPQLAQTILLHNKKAKKTLINLKGIIMGNALINEETDEKGMYDFLAGHALISDTTLKQIQTYCDFSPNAKSNPKCDDVKVQAFYNVSSIINIYNIYAPVCRNSNLTARPKEISCEIDPCSDDYIYAYLNRPDVQEALHANVTKLDHDWDLCSDLLGHWLDRPKTMIPLLEEFMANGLRIWYFSGDTDGRVPFTSTTYSLKLMKLKVKSLWRPWMTNGQVGGYTEEYEGNLTYATVRGAGHEVPSYQPGRALALISHFLNGTSLPKPQ